MTYYLETLSPRAVSQGEINKLTLVSRPKSLQGQRIGLITNGKRGGDVALRRVGQALEGRFPDCQVTFFEGHHRPVEAAIMERAKKSECSVFLGATAD